MFTGTSTTSSRPECPRSSLQSAQKCAPAGSPCRFLDLLQAWTFRPTSSPRPTVLVGRYHVKKHFTITSNTQSHVCHNGALFSARLEPTGWIMSASEVRSRTLAVNMSRMCELCTGPAQKGVNSQQKRRSDLDSCKKSLSRRAVSQHFQQGYAGDFACP